MCNALFDRYSGKKSKLSGNFRGITKHHIFISWTTIREYIWDIFFCDLRDLLDHLQDTSAHTCSYIEDTTTLSRFCICEQMCTRKVIDINIITHTRAINSLIICTKNRNVRSSTYGNLHQIREKIIRGSARDFTNISRLMCANRIKVAKKCHLPA